MIYLFHFFTIAFIVYEFLWVLYPEKHSNEMEKFRNLSKLNKNKKFNEYSDEYVNLLKYKGCTALVFFMWMVVGFFTFSWVAFVFFLVMQIFIITPISKKLIGTRYYVLLNWVNSILGLVFGVFVLVNDFHLHINLMELITTLIN